MQSGFTASEIVRQYILKPRIQFLQQSNAQGVFSVLCTNRGHAEQGIRQIELLAGRKELSTNN